MLEGVVPLSPSKDGILCALISCTADAEMIWAKVSFSKVSILVGAFYKPLLLI